MIPKQVEDFITRFAQELAKIKGPDTTIEIVAQPVELPPFIHRFHDAASRFGSGK